MKIKQIETKNFRSLSDGVYSLNRINVLIGKNGTGKTSFQKAIRYILTGKADGSYVRTGEEYMYVSAVLDDGQDTKVERLMYLPASFQINGKEVKEKEFHERVTALMNSGMKLKAEGNTNPAFYLFSDALLWDFRMTGKTEKMSGIKQLEVVLSDGTRLYERVSKPSKAAVNGKSVTAKVLAELIADRSGGEISVLDILPSSEVLSAMDMKDFSRYLMSIIPMQIDFEVLCSLGDVSPEERSVLTEFFPPSPAKIGVQEIETAYQRLFTRRADLGRALTAAKQKSVFNGSVPSSDKVSIQETIGKIAKSIGAADQINSAWTVYDRRVADRQRQVDMFNAWAKEYNSMTAQKPSDDDIKEADAQERKIRKDIDDGVRNVTSIRQNSNMLKTMLLNLDTKVCPLCDSLECTTDKTSCKKDLEEMLSKNDAVEASIVEKHKLLQKDLEAVIETKEKLRSQKEAYEKKTALYNKIMALRNAIPPVPEKPQDKIDVSSLQIEYSKKQEELGQILVFEEAKKEEAKAEELSKQYSLLNTLVKKSEPKKGLFTQKVLEYLLTPFMQKVNSFTKSIHNDMEVSFKMEDSGLTLLCKPHGRDFYINVNSLSTGEKMLIVFALMDLVSEISGSKLLVFDGLESLDPASIDKLMDTINQVSSGYDHIILSFVEYDETKEILKKYPGANIINL